jgi:transposase
VIRPRASLLSEVKQLEDALVKTAKTDPICRRLMTVPGVGPLTALAFKAAVDDPARFRSSRTVGAYFGLTPRRRQSGQMDVSGHISRMGDETVRTALYSAAFALLTVSKSKCPLRLWGLRLKEGKGHKLATVAVARKMAVIMHRMWVTERDFDPTERPSGRRA